MATIFLLLVFVPLLFECSIYFFTDINSELLAVWHLFKGGNYSRAVSIQQTMVSMVYLGLGMRPVYLGLGMRPGVSRPGNESRVYLGLGMRPGIPGPGNEARCI